MLGQCVLGSILGCDGGSTPPPSTPPVDTGCTAASECNDGQGCTLDVCLASLSLSLCVSSPILGCRDGGDECSSAADCEGGGLLSACVDGRCVLGAPEDVSECSTSSDCDGILGSGLGLCLLGSCVLSDPLEPPEELPVLCDTASACNDSDVCTLDVCVEALGLCAWVRLDDCEGGGDGTGGASGSGGSTNGSGSRDGGGGGTGSGSMTGSSGGGDGADGDSGDGADGGVDSGDGTDAAGDDEDGLEYVGGACSFEAPRGAGPLAYFLAFLAVAAVVSRRSRSRMGARRVAGSYVGPLGLVLLLSVWTGQAQAQGFAVDTTRPPVAPEDLLVTERPAIPMDHLSFFGRAMLGYAYRPLVARDAAGNETPVIDSQAALYLSGGVAFLERFHLAALLPLYAQTDGASLGGANVSGFAVGNPGLDARVTILDTRRPFELGLAGSLTLPVGSSGQYAADEAASGGARVLVGKSWGEDARSFVALNAGLSFRQNATLANVQMGNQIVFGAGVHWALFGPLGVTGEVSGSTTWEDAFSSDQTPLGLLLGLRYSGDGFAFAAGAGPGLTPGVGNPEVRALALGGARWNRHDEPAAERAAAPAAAEPVVAERAPALDPCDSAAPPKDPQACPRLDADNDGIRNHDDACPLHPEDLDGFEDADGCPESDNDRDGIADDRDRCPLDAETVNGIDDEDGCPDKIRVENGQIATLEPIFFETGSAKLAERSQPLLSEMARVIRARPELGVISIEGHTDSRGSDQRNLILSRDRAASVRTFLIDAGVEGSRLTAVGYGETRPIAAGETAAAHSMNRRVEFRFDAPTTQLTASTEVQP